MYAGRACDDRESLLNSYIRILELYCQEKKSIEVQIKQMITEEIDSIDNSVENLKSIPGVSDKTIAAIFGECGDLKRFNSAKAFIGYLGLFILGSTNLDILTPLVDLQSVVYQSPNMLFI